MGQPSRKLDGLCEAHIPGKSSNDPSKNFQTDRAKQSISPVVAAISFYNAFAVFGRKKLIEFVEMFSELNE